MLGFLLRTLITAAGLWIASRVVDGFVISTPGTLLIAGLLLGVINAIVRPIAIVLTLPLTLVTLGLFLLVVNAAMVALVAWILPGFEVAGFWAAFLGALIVTVTGWIGSAFVGKKGLERLKR